MKGWTFKAMISDRYYYRRQARIVYRQPVGMAFSEADLAIWTSSCDMADRLVAELERLRIENVELRRELNNGINRRAGDGEMVGA